jgi:DNA-directed RNA polymerase specialized sigma24 family protein
MIAGKGPGFPVTRWSVVLAASGADSPRRLKALEELCSAYWRPLYCFIRAGGHSPPEAEDLTQGFFAHLLTRNALANLSPDKGLFRSYLLANLKHFLADARDRANALKRGRGQALISLDNLFDELESPVPDPALNPEQGFDRHWAMTVLNRAFRALGEEYATSGKSALFKRLSVFLSREGTGAEYDQLGAKLEMSGGAVAVSVHRMRQSYRALVRREVAHTVANPWEIDGEMRYLLQLVTG